MADPAAFLKHERREPPSPRSGKEPEGWFAPGAMETQASRCLDCGLPYCHGFGCPLAGRIPDWNDLLFRGKWRRALEIIHRDNNFPEFTGRLCPAPCEAACTLALRESPVTIRQTERHLAEEGWRRGWIAPSPALVSTGRRAAVVGSGPAGLAAAQELARRGHRVMVFEKSDRPGGLLRYGIPGFKLEKSVLDRRLEQLTAEGVTWENGVEAGRGLALSRLARDFDAVVLATGSGPPRELKIPGRELAGIVPAMELLVRSETGPALPPEDPINPGGKSVVVIGGGDTGDDCVESCLRSGASVVRQLEILPRPRTGENILSIWPLPPPRAAAKNGEHILWSVATLGFLGKEGRVAAVRCARLEYPEDSPPRPGFGRVIPGSEFEIPAELVVLALGFEKADPSALLRDCPGGEEKFFAAGDLLLGPSLVAKAVASGRAAAAAAGRTLENTGPGKR